VKLWLRNILQYLKPRHRLRVVQDDSLPEHIGTREVVVVEEDGENWVAGLYCPCGCGDRIELMLLQGVRPRWDAAADAEGRPTLYPSVWRKEGCCSHFWLRNGRVRWC
jgi:hypothetical protein